jgi:hypothetical protein
MWPIGEGMASDHVTARDELGVWSFVWQLQSNAMDNHPDTESGKRRSS